MKRTLIAAIVLAGAGLVFAAGTFVGWRSAGTSGRAAAEREALYYACPMHPQFRSDRAGDCPSCGMRLEPVFAEGSSGAISAGGDARLSTAASIHISPDRQQVIGVQIGRAERKPITHAVRTSGRVAADETRVYRITAATSGWVEQALPNSVGSLVRKDELLGTFYAREFLSAQQAYFYALDARDRFVAQGAGEAQMASTNVQIQQSVDTLRALGMTATQIEELGKKRERTYTVEIRAPAAGFILVRNISPGQRFDSGDDLYAIVDLGSVWILADVFEHEAKWLRPNDLVNVIYQGEQFTAVVSDVLPIFDAEARTMKMRLNMKNPTYRFRPGMFVDVEFRVSRPPAVTVPAAAVVDSGTRKTVFVDRGNGYFESRQVETGWRLGDQVEIVRGLMPEERIVISGTFLIDSESRMRAAAQGIAGDAAQDPICGMSVDEKKAAAAGLSSEYQGRKYYFCADECKKTFDASPAAYAAK